MQIISQPHVLVLYLPSYARKIYQRGILEICASDMYMNVLCTAENLERLRGIRKMRQGIILYFYVAQQLNKRNNVLTFYSDHRNACKHLYQQPHYLEGYYLFYTVQSETLLDILHEYIHKLKSKSSYKFSVILHMIQNIFRSSHIL